jgi:protocatechuate 3,4-dioxygenase beta subunit/5-hydroxyisourate hydrolase-like protein (transthyretin family)
MKRALFLILALPLFSLDAQVIRGRVVDADAKPVAGAHVQAVLAERSSLDFIHNPSATTTKDGRYELPAPPFADTERAAIAVTLPAHATVRSTPFQIGPGDLEVAVKLPRFDRLTVRVADRAGKPVAKARVAFASSEDVVALRSPATLLMEQFAKLNVPTDDDGEAVLYLLPGTWDFAAVADDFQPATISERLIKRPGSIAMTLEPAVTISGRVHRNGTGVAQAQVVILQGERRSREDRPTSTDADGAFEIRGLSPGPYRVSIVKEEELLRRVVETKAPAKLDVALPPAGTLRTRIVDADTRQPVREFFYSIESLDQPDADNWQTSLTTDNGTIHTTVPSGTYRVTAAAVGYTMTKPVDVRVKEGEPADLTIALDRGITITGRVTDDHGVPVADAAIFVESAAMQERRVGPGNAHSAADGSFTVSGIDAGSVALIVRKDGFVPFRKPFTLDSPISVDVQLTRGLSLEGVVRRGGKPVPDVHVEAVTAGMGGGQQPAKTDANGRFVLRGLVPARYTISAYSETAHTQVDNVDPAKTRELVLSLDPKPTGVLHGTVTGLPTNLGGKITRRAVFAQGTDRGVDGTIDDAGNYRIEDAPTGVVYLTAQLETTSGGRSSVRKRVEIAAGQELRVDLDLTSPYSVRGRVTQDGKPTAGVRVVFANDTGLAGSATSRADGTYEVALPSAGTYQIFAHSETLSTGNIQLVREIRGGETVDIELREQVIEGTVVDTNTREPLQGVRVTLAPENAPAEWHAGEVMSDSNGRFRMLTAASGNYRVVAWMRGYAQRAQVIQLGNARPSQVTFELTKTDDLRVRVIDARTGTPLAAHVVIAGPDGTYLPVRCDRDADGASHLCSLAPGKYRLTVVVQGYAERMLEVTAPGTVDVLME